MKKTLSLIAFLLIAISSYAGDALYKTLTFPDGNQKSIGSYTDTWDAICEDFTWTLQNFNNNKNAWAFVKCGRKNTASVANISTGQVSEVISKFVVTIDDVTASKVNATYLEVASDAAFTADVQKTTITIAKGEMTYAVENPKANQYYRLVYDCAGGSANGLVVISKVEMYKFDSSTLSEPLFSPVGGNYYDPQSITITSPQGADVYYSFDNADFSKYTSPIALTYGDQKTIYAYADNGTMKSGVKSSEYFIAKKYANLEELLKETPTEKGYPVIVNIDGEEIASFYGGTDYRNGVYVTRQANGKNFELYCKDAPMTWNVGDKLYGTAMGIYQDYNGQWEISLLSWDGITNGEVAVQAPVISFDEASKTVTITDPSGNNNSIFYTLDGTNPDDSKQFYEAPFTINATTTVKAICYDDLDQTSAITTKVCSVAGEALKTCADLVANCTTTEGANITFEFTDLLVTSASGQYVFVKDNTAPFLLFNKSSYKRGDKLTGSVSGKLYIYNGVKELAVNDWNNVTVASSGNEVTPEKVAVTDVTPAKQNTYIRIEGLKYTKVDGQYYYFTDGTNELTVYDKFKLMSGVAISESNTYNINGVATVYKETPQVYVFDVKDVEVISTKADPQTTIEKAEFKALLAEEKVNIKYETKSDARLFWASTNPNVATVEDGVVTLLGTGFTEITLETEENETYQASKATMKLYVFSGADATENNPYDAGDVQAAMLYEKADTIANVWVKGYLVGFANGSLGKAVFGTEGAVLTNILIAKNPNETDVNNCIPVALETKPAAAKTIREELNLVDHPENLGKEIILNGSIIAYFSVPGMKSLKAYKFAEGGKKGDADEDGDVTVSDITTIASYILGNNPQPFNFNNADVDGDSAITVSDITGTASIILGTN